MANDIPIACSLVAGELQQRLAEIAEVGASSLLSRAMDGNSHLLRFRQDPATQQQLEGIIAAEAECCAFLDLSLRENKGELVMSIAAPEDAQALADGFADAFCGSRMTRLPGRC